MSVTRFKPTKKQWEALSILLNKNGKNHILFGGAASAGKSYLGCAWLVISCLKYPGTRWLMGRTSLTALRASTLATFLDLIREWDLTSYIKINFQSNTIQFNNGSTILMKDLEYKPSDPNFDSLGSIELTGAFIDEASQLTERAYEVIGSRLRYRLEEYDLEAKLLMTCNPSKNFLYNLFYQPYIKNEIAYFRYFIPATYKDNEYTSTEYIKNLDKLSPDLIARLKDGNWDFEATDNQLIKPHQIYNLPTSVYDNNSQPYLTCDPARFGKDRSVSFIWKGNTVVDCIIFEKTDLQTQINEIKQIILRYKIPNSNIIVDSDGVGGGIADALRARPIVNNSRPINKENFSNLKTQLYYKLSEKIDNIRIVENVWNKKIGKDTLGELLAQELTYIRSDSESDNKLSIMKKDRIKELIGRSPDFSDALAYKMLNELSVPLKVARR